MPSKKMKLYLAKCLSELNKKAEVNQKWGATRMLVKSAETVFKSAETALQNGDEEKAYVMYMKFFNVRSAAKKCSDYKANEKYVKSMLDNDLAKCLEEAERLSESLKNRYDELEAGALKVKLDTLDEERNKRQMEEKSKKEEGEKKQEEKKKNEENAANSLNVTTTEEESTPGAISVQQLYTLLQDGSGLIALDIRPAEQYQASRINYKSVINIPADIVKPGCTVKDIEKNMPEESKSLWSQRGVVDQIVLIDWQCSARNMPVGSTLRSLKDAIFKWDQKVIIRSEPLVLEGGYDNWLLYYPTLTTNANIPRPPGYGQVKSDTLSLDFDYPDFEETFAQKIAQTPQTNITNESQNGQQNGALMNNFVGPQSMPTVDRSKKPALQKIQNNLKETENSGNTKTNSGGGLFDQLREQLNDVSSHSMVTNFKPDNTVLEKKMTQLPDKTESKASLPNIPSRTLKPQPNVYHDNSKASNFDSNIKPAVNNGESVQASKELETKISASEVKIANLKAEEKQVEDLQQLKQKEVKSLADVLRAKRKVTEELKILEHRKAELASVTVEVDEKKRLQEEVQKLRSERKLREQAEEIIKLKAELEDRNNRESVDKAEASKVEVERKNKESEDGAKLEAENRQEEREKEKQRILQENERKELERLEAEEKRREQELAQQQAKEEAEKKAREEAEIAEKARLAAEERLRVETEEAKQKARLDAQARENARQAELQEKARLEAENAQGAEKARLEEEIVRLEAEAREKARMEAEVQEKSCLEAQAREKAKKEEEAARQTRMSQEQLPSGWQKKFDGKTGKTFYVDHNSGTTHWVAPIAAMKSSNINTTSIGDTGLTRTPKLHSLKKDPETYKTSLKHEPDAPRSGGLKRSNSSPNIAKLVQDNKENHMPSVDRKAKPSERPQHVEPRPKPVFQGISANRLRQLNPLYGGQGHGLTGLRNMGNTCYINSIVQCLSNTGALAYYFMEEIYKDDVNKHNFLGHNGDIAEEFGFLLFVLWKLDYRSVTPWSLKHMVAKYADRFSTSEQQDSQEFLVFLLDGLHEDLNRVKERPKLAEIDTDKMGHEEAAMVSWEQHKQLNRSFLVELFQGQLRSIVQCSTCKKQSVKFDTFMFLSLPLPANKSRCSLQDCLKLFLEGEKMSGDSKWNCPVCKTRRDAVKKIDIWKLPHILLIHFKRFYFRGMWRDKLSTSIDFPINNMDMRNIVVGPKKPAHNYNLYALSLHKGQSMEHGHYTAYCKSPSDERWYDFDDQDVFKASESDIRAAQSQAYILFYSMKTNKLSFN